MAHFPTTEEHTNMVQKVIDEQRWGAQRVSKLLLKFIAEQGLESQLSRFMVEEAREENGVDIEEATPSLGGHAHLRKDF